MQSTPGNREATRAAGVSEPVGEAGEAPEAGKGARARAHRALWAVRRVSAFVLGNVSSRGKAQRNLDFIRILQVAI